MPTADALRSYADDPDALKTALTGIASAERRRTPNCSPTRSRRTSWSRPSRSARANGLLSGVGKLLRPKLKEHYGERLEQLYADLADARVDELRALREAAADRPVVDTVVLAAQALLGLPAPTSRTADAHFIDLGGDSLSALTFSNLLQEIFDVEVPVGVIIGPAATCRHLADYIEAEKAAGSERPTFATVHGADATEVRAGDLTLDKFIDAATLTAAKTLPPRDRSAPRRVLLTGANGYLGRFLCPGMAGTAVRRPAAS